MSKVICITGATAGIGRATALRFIREGWKVIATGRRSDRLDELAREAGANCFPITMDVRDENSVKAGFAALPEAFKPIDVLLNNAGLALGLGPSQEADMADWEQMIDTNIKGLLYCTRIVLPEMVKRGSGYIINIGSIAGNHPYKGGNVYGATKAFVAQLSKNLRCDVHGSGVRVTNVEPGMLKSEFSLVRFKGDADKADQVYEQSDYLTPEDLADVIFSLASLPERVNVNHIQIMPTCQSDGGPIVARKKN